MSDASYWDEVVQISLNEAGLTATKDQVLIISGSIEGCVENYLNHTSPGTGRRTADPEVVSLKKRLAEEEAKVPCSKCAGRGHLIVSDQYNFRAHKEGCDACYSTGRVLP
jgi:DnaJ-class molecular chaperone